MSLPFSFVREATHTHGRDCAIECIAGVVVGETGRVGGSRRNNPVRIGVVPAVYRETQINLITLLSSVRLR